MASVVVNNGTIIGGTGLAAGGRGGAGARIATTTLTNNGTIRGGAGTGAFAGGNAFELLANTSLTNNGLVEGGSGATGNAGVSVQAAGGSLVNNGTIRGGTGTAGSTSAAGVAFLAALDSFINRGTIEGGTGGAGIQSSSTTISLNIVNSGTITAGTGQANAIFVASGASNSLTLELQAGSVIEGNVVANATATSDVLRLGGATNASFDASTIGNGAQYRNFDRFEKTGSSTWTLTGETTAVTPWRLAGGTLSIASDGSLGVTSGVLTFDGGTLQTTANTTSARNVVINARGGTVQAGADLSWSGVVSGSGALTKTGSGTLVLTGANTYTGGTTIAAGTVQVGDGGTAGSITGNVANDGTLAFNRSDNATFAGAVSGSGSLQQAGGGTLTLTGNSSHTGGTTIRAGTLQLGDGGSTGSIVGDVANNGTLAFNRSDDVTFAGSVSGSGGVQKQGAGSLTLTGANSYSGGTVITAGTLIGSATSFGSGRITNTGALVIDQRSDASFANAISGSGSFTKTGSGVLDLTGDSAGLTGATTISEGALVVNGSLAGSAVTVASGSRLGGSGTVGATTVASGGRITPGNSIGTLTVNGAYVQNAGAVYEVEVDPTSGTSDRIDVKGTATLANGASVSVINYTGGTFVAGQRYTILTSTGLTGSYGGDLTLSAFLALRNSSDATNAYLTVVRTATAGSAGNTGNEQAVGNAVDSLPAGNAVQTGVYNQPTVEAGRGALGQLAGEIHASTRTVLVDESWLLRSAVTDRLRSAFGAVGSAPMASLSYGFTADLAPAVKGPLPKPPPAERFAVWGQGYGSWGRTSGDGNAASLSRSTGGLLVGADAAVFEVLRLGVVAGFSHSKFDVNGRLSSGESDNYHLGLYGGGQWGALSLRTGLSYTWHDLSTRRSIVSAGLGDTLQADYDAGTAQAFGELGYRIDLGQTALGQVALEPFAGLAYVVLRSDRFSERGTGAAALSGASDDTSLGYTTLGLRAATTARLSGMDLTLRGGLGWRHAFGDVDPKTTLAFAGSNPFGIAGLPIARDAALVEAGLDVALGSNMTLGASYTAQLAEDAQDHAFKANFAIRF
ncbi:MAG: autotransporter domain-containing protein [Bosea sp.]|uniref:autotransporter outer membrane beta-barrel domain-containing protein n=1 Tax=Bosea sp. (in: a-proteobacteria) TaxID=1871050 RepID=UPI00239B095E|nr:autotransporter domain-containing protein [Bosea sp. (in: a-proteobacteria)]MCP4732599.1 autotransporter domain-containing protein [Bosea sp. (in: a-proteobacteria)]